MNNCLVHRGPDNHGIWVDETTGTALGHTRLSIIDPSGAGSQPMLSHSGRFVIVFNGEIYNYREMAESLESENRIQFRGHADTEVFLEYIADRGIAEALKKANGMFAFGLWDKVTESLTLARDRFGKKPLYFGWCESGFVFASELKSIMALPGFGNEISKQALELFFNNKNIPTPYSIFEDIYKLPSATYVEFGYEELSRISAYGEIASRMNSYWSLNSCIKPNKNRSDTSITAAKKEFRRLLKASVRRRMISDVPLGAFLSGGIDSSLIVSLMQEISERPVKTFTIGFSNRDFDEAATARQIAGILGTDHSEHYFEEDDAFSIVPQLAKIYDEPFADFSQIPTVLVSQLARKDVTVALSGDGGDELMAGYNRHVFAEKLGSINNKIPQLLRNMIPTDLIARYEDTIQQLYDTAAKTAFVQKNHRQFGNKTVKTLSVLGASDEKDMYRLLLKNRLVIDNLLSSGRDMHEAPDILFKLESLPDELSLTEKLMYWDVKNFLMDGVLVKVDRASMSVGLEARSPLLDYHLFNYVWGLPANFLRDNNSEGKRIMKLLLSDFLPSEVLSQPKSGFILPIGQWLRGPLREWADELIFNSKDSYTYINKLYVEEIWQKHLSKKGNWAEEIWTILMFLMWYREYMEDCS